jgi:hypothetical protein
MKIDIKPAQQADLEELQRLFREENRFHAVLVPEYIQATDDMLRPTEFAADTLHQQRRALPPPPLCSAPATTPATSFIRPARKKPAMGNCGLWDRLICAAQGAAVNH